MNKGSFPTELSTTWKASRDKQGKKDISECEKTAEIRETLKMMGKTMKQGSPVSE